MLCTVGRTWLETLSWATAVVTGCVCHFPMGIEVECFLYRRMVVL